MGGGCRDGMLRCFRRGVYCACARDQHGSLQSATCYSVLHMTAVAMWVSVLSTRHRGAPHSAQVSFLTPGRPYHMWSVDYHISPIADIKSLFASGSWPWRDVHVIDKSLSGHCHLTNTCATDLRVLTSANVMNLACPTRAAFYQEYSHDPEFSTVNSAVCTLALGSCELYMAFNKSIIIYVATRYDLGRNMSPSWWSNLNAQLQRIASKPWNWFVVNNLFDKLYLYRYTGIVATGMPSLALYVGDTYHPVRPEVLIFPARRPEPAWMQWLLDLPAQTMSSLVHIRDLYPKYSFAQLSQHPAVLFFPYQTSLMSFFELYRMGIPIVAPSLTLLVGMHTAHRVVADLLLPGAGPPPPPIENCDSQAQGRELLWNQADKWRMLVGSRSQFPRHLFCFDPAKQNDTAHMQFWLQFSDIFVFPHIVHFSSHADLVNVLARTNFRKLSLMMRQFWTVEKSRVMHAWGSHLKHIEAHRRAAFRVGGLDHANFSTSLMSIYQEEIPDSCGPPA